MSKRVNQLRFFSCVAVAIILPVILQAAEPQDLSTQWKIRSIRVCRDQRGYLIPSVEVLGSYPVYSFLFRALFGPLTVPLLTQDRSTRRGN